MRGQPSLHSPVKTRRAGPVMRVRPVVASCVTVKLAAGQPDSDPRPARRLSAPDSNGRDRARPGTARKGRPDAPLPDGDAEHVAPPAYELDVRASLDLGHLNLKQFVLHLSAVIGVFLTRKTCRQRKLIN